MEVLKKGYNSEILVPVTAILESERFLFLEGEINQSMADEFAKQVMHLVIQDNTTPINVIIDSGGGEVDAGLKICDIVSTCPCKVNAFCFGKAYSMGAIIFESVNGERCLIGNSKLMLHQPSVQGLQHGTAGEVEALSKRLRAKNDFLLSIVADKCKWSLKKLKEETVADRYFEAEEALKLNLVDRIVNFLDVMSF